MQNDPQLSEHMAELLALMTEAGWVEASRVQSEKLEIVYTQAGQHALKQITDALSPLGPDLSSLHGLPLLMLLWLDNNPPQPT